MYDFIGIGIGPFNLSLAALTEDMSDLNGIFFDQSETFQWHPGLLIEGTDLQVPFIADLVSFADPTNRFSYLNYLHINKRLNHFYFLNKMSVPRKEYNDYLQWVASQITQLHFGKEVIDVIDENNHYKVIVRDISTQIDEEYLAKHIVMATGGTPLILDNMANYPQEDILHASNYLYKKEKIIDADHITIVGSGQSAAEIFHDLLDERKNKEFHLSWITRSEGIFQLESAKLGQEFFSLDYVDYFHHLPIEKRKDALNTLGPLRNGVDYDTLIGIYKLLYHYSIGGEDPQIFIQPLTEVKSLEETTDGYFLECHQWQAEKSFQLKTEKVIFATGYKPNIPDWFEKRFHGKIEWEDKHLFKVSRNYALSFKDQRKHRFYVATNLEHSHGTAATNLGLAVQRNMEIINDLTNEQRFDLSGSFIFQNFIPSN